MHLTTDGVTVAVGVLIAGALAVGTVATLRDDADSLADEVACVSQPRPQARQAQQAFATRFGEQSAAAWLVGYGLSKRAAVNDMIRESGKAGLPKGDPLSAKVGDDWVLLVMYDADARLPTKLPACIDDTPIAYVPSSGPFTHD